MNYLWPSLNKIRFKPKVVVKRNESEVDNLAAGLVESQLSKKRDSVFVFPTGSTPLGIYQKLVERNKKKKNCFKFCTIFNLDEYFPIRKINRASYCHYMKFHFLNYVDMDLKKWFIADGEEISAEISALKFQEKIDRCLIFDLAILGLGPGSTCHIGFNEKGSLLESKTRYVKLSTETRNANSIFFSSQTDTPDGAVTMGISDILKAKKIVVVAKGEKKAWGVWRTLTGSIGSDAPSSYLRLHPAVTFILDKSAALLI